MLRNQRATMIGDCVAVISEPAHGMYVIETAFGKQFTVSKGNIGIIYTDPNAIDEQ
jgi:hypothetical protein